MLSCVLSYSTTKARLMGFNPNAIQPTRPPALHKANEVGNIFRDTPMGRSSTIENKQISIAPAETKLPSTLKVTVQGSLGHNHAHGIKEAETVAGGTQIFSKRPSESNNDSARMKKVDAVMAFRPSSSGHSPGIGHDDPPGPML